MMEKNINKYAININKYAIIVRIICYILIPICGFVMLQSIISLAFFLKRKK